MPLTDPVGVFKHFYTEFDQHDLNLLGGVYSDDITFTDPVHTIRGLGNLKTYFGSMCRNLTHCRFQFEEEVIGEGQAFFKWEMSYSHPSLKSNAKLTLTGATLIKYSDKIHYHEDFYDMGAMLYEYLPLLGSAVRFVKARLEKNVGEVVSCEKHEQ